METFEITMPRQTPPFKGGETETQEGIATGQSPQRVDAGMPHACSRKPNLYGGHAQGPNP